MVIGDDYDLEKPVEDDNNLEFEEKKYGSFVVVEDENPPSQNHEYQIVGKFTGSDRKIIA